MKKLLVCIDGSMPYTESCLKHTELLIKKLNMTADILYVTDAHQFDFALMGDFSGSLGVQPYQDLYNKLQKIEEKKVEFVRNIVEKFFKKAKLSDKVTFKHENGSLVDSCQAYENSEIGVDLLMIGKRGENASFAAEHLGANLERVVRASGRPCWISTKNFRQIKKMALAYDDSPSTNHAIQFLIRSPLEKGISIDLVFANQKSNCNDDQKNMFNKAEEALNKAGYNVKTNIINGEASEVISNFVNDNEIDLLLMGAYGHSAIRHLIIGSTTTQLIRSCKISILLFR